MSYSTKTSKLLPPQGLNYKNVGNIVLGKESKSDGIKKNAVFPAEQNELSGVFLRSVLEYEPSVRSWNIRFCSGNNSIVLKVSMICLLDRVFLEVSFLYDRRVKMILLSNHVFNLLFWACSGADFYDNHFQAKCAAFATHVSSMSVWRWTFHV